MLNKQKRKTGRRKEVKVALIGEFETADLTYQGALYQLSYISTSWSEQRESNPHHRLEG